MAKDDDHVHDEKCFPDPLELLGMAVQAVRDQFDIPRLVLASALLKEACFTSLHCFETAEEITERFKSALVEAALDYKNCDCQKKGKPHVH